LLPNQTGKTDLTYLIEFIERIASAGVDMVQIRERDLSAKDLYCLTKAVNERLRGKGALIMINDRADIASCTGAGVHLTTRSLPTAVMRTAFGPDILIGVSTHNQEEAEAAERGGADFIVFGPVFETPSKTEYRDPVGLAALNQVTNRLTIPVIALGGVKLSNFREALDAGAAGVAGISMFTEAFTETFSEALVTEALVTEAVAEPFAESRDLNGLVSRIKNLG
jgi:thiamine-phosphate pyrophosphorylase